MGKAPAELFERLGMDVILGFTIEVIFPVRPEPEGREDGLR